MELRDLGALVQAALDLGWTLWAYEADVRHPPPELVAEGSLSAAFTDWRELEQARNLVGVLGRLPGRGRAWLDPVLERLRPALESLGGTAGFLRADAPAPFDDWPGVDAVLLSTDNAME
jgi:hypothetical protein